MKKLALIVLGVIVVVIILISNLKNTKVSNFNTYIPNESDSKNLVVALEGKGIPKIEELEQKVDFKVLLPKTIPDGFSYDKYGAYGYPKASNVTIFLKGSNNKTIQLVEFDNEGYTPFPDRKDVQYVTILGKKASYYENNVSSDKTIIQDIIQWRDDNKRVLILFTPSSLFTKQQVVDFASSLYE